MLFSIEIPETKVIININGILTLIKNEMQDLFLIKNTINIQFHKLVKHRYVYR